MIIPSFKAGIFSFIRGSAVVNKKLYGWGLNTLYRLGLGDTTQRTSPTQLGSDVNWEYVGSIALSTLAVKTTGTLWAWGRNSNGQLGVGDTTDRTTPTQVGSSTDWSKVYGQRHTIALKTTGSLWAWDTTDTVNSVLVTILKEHHPFRLDPIQLGLELPVVLYIQWQ